MKRLQTHQPARLIAVAGGFLQHTISAVSGRVAPQAQDSVALDDLYLIVL